MKNESKKVNLQFTQRKWSRISLTKRHDWENCRIPRKECKECKKLINEKIYNMFMDLLNSWKFWKLSVLPKIGI